MEPKGLPEFPGKSRKSPPRRPRTSQESPGTPKETPKHASAAKRTSEDPQKWAHGPQMTPQGLPETLPGLTKASKGHPKKHPKRHQREMAAALGGSAALGRPSQARRWHAEATSRPRILQKSIPKSWSILERLLEAKMLPKTSQNDPQNHQKFIENAMQFSIEFFVRFSIDFCSFSQSPDLRFHWYLQHFRGVQQFSRS